MAEKFFNVRLPLVAIVSGKSEKDAVDRMSKIVMSLGFEVYEDLPSEGGPHAFEAEDSNDSGETLPNRYL